MIIGEASSRLSVGLKNKYDEIDWQAISGFRNIIVHAYFNLSLPIIWEAATENAKELQHNIASILIAEYPSGISNSDF